MILGEMHRVVAAGRNCYLYEADRGATAVPEGWVDRTLGWPPERLVLSGWRRFGMNAEEWAAVETMAQSAGFREVRTDRHGFYRRMVMTK